jgi:hypothetical protein
VPSLPVRAAIAVQKNVGTGPGSSRSAEPTLVVVLLANVWVWEINIGVVQITE